MSTVLITGTSGFLGKALAKEMASRHQVIGMSRKNPGLETKWIRGEFHSFEDLRQLDQFKIDAVVHLAAVTGGCLERDGMLVNVEGTRCLMRYLMDRGCRKFVMASSIAVVGLQSPEFRPVRLQIPDEHPCLDRDGYGFSKYMMEEVTRYYQRQKKDLDVINLRLAAICGNDSPGEPEGIRPLSGWCLCGLTQMLPCDAVRAFATAAEAPHKPGVRVLNATTPRAWTTVPTADVLRNWWGKDTGVAHYLKPGHEFDSVYDVSAIRKELGFVAERSMEFLATRQRGTIGDRP